MAKISFNRIKSNAIFYRSTDTFDKEVFSLEKKNRENDAFKSSVIDINSLAHAGFIICRRAVDSICFRGQRWAHFRWSQSEVVNNLTAKIDYLTLASGPSSKLLLYFKPT